MPTTMLGGLVMYVAFLRIGIVVLQAILDLFHRFEAASSLDGWGTALSVLLVFSASLLLLRWVRTRLLWSLRNRLIVTYMFIGVMPVVLILAMVGIAGYLVANQYAISQARLELDNEIQSLQTMNASVSAQIAEQISIASSRSEKKLLPPEIRYLQKRFPGLEVEAYADGKRIASSVTPSAQATVALPAWLKTSFDGVVLDQGALYLRSVVITKVGKQTLTVLASVPLSNQVLAQAAKTLGAVKITTPVTEEAGEKRPELFVNRDTQNKESQKTEAANSSRPAPKKFTVRRDSKANVSG